MTVDSDFRKEKHMPLKYQTGEPVMLGDRVQLDKESGVIELIVDSTADDPIARWHLENHGKGVIISQLEQLGCAYSDPEEDSDLKLLGRAIGPPIGRKERP
jgi:hypothetical protein